MLHPPSRSAIDYLPIQIAMMNSPAEPAGLCGASIGVDLYEACLSFLRQELRTKPRQGVRDLDRGSLFRCGVPLGGGMTFDPTPQIFS